MQWSGEFHLTTVSMFDLLPRLECVSVRKLSLVELVFGSKDQSRKFLLMIGLCLIQPVLRFGRKSILQTLNLTYVPFIGYFHKYMNILTRHDFHQKSGFL
jgi:hypothetical protein